MTQWLKASLRSWVWSLSLSRHAEFCSFHSSVRGPWCHNEVCDIWTPQPGVCANDSWSVQPRPQLLPPFPSQEHRSEACSLHYAAQRGLQDPCYCNSKGEGKGLKTNSRYFNLCFILRFPMNLPYLKMHVSWNDVLVTHMISNIFHLSFSTKWYKISIF